MRKLRASLALCVLAFAILVALPRPAAAVDNGEMDSERVNHGNLIQYGSACAAGDGKALAPGTPSASSTWWWLLSLLNAGLR